MFWVFWSSLSLPLLPFELDCPSCWSLFLQHFCPPVPSSLFAACFPYRFVRGLRGLRFQMFLLFGWMFIFSCGVRVKENVGMVDFLICFRLLCCSRHCRCFFHIFYFQHTIMCCDQSTQVHLCRRHRLLLHDNSISYLPGFHNSCVCSRVAADPTLFSCRSSVLPVFPSFVCCFCRWYFVDRDSTINGSDIINLIIVIGETLICV